MFDMRRLWLPSKHNGASRSKEILLADEFALIWSNGNKHSSIAQYREALHSADLSKYSLHVFMNTCVPLQAAPSRFKSCRCMFIGRQCSDKRSLAKFFGQSCLAKYHQLFIAAYAVSNSFYAAKLATEDADDAEALAAWTENADMKLQIDDYYARHCPCSKYGHSTGFLAYCLLKQLGCTSISLCNFGISDSRLKRTQCLHSIDTELQWYKDKNVPQLQI